MADDVVVSSGSYSATIAADEVAGVKYQRAKLVWGPDGTVNDADVASGKPLPIQLRTAAGADLVAASGGVKVELVAGALPAGTNNIGDVDVLTVPALFTDGTQKAIARGAAKGSTAAADVTATSIDADHTAIDVNILAGGGTGGTASSYGAAFPATGTAVGGTDGTNMVSVHVKAANPASTDRGWVVRPVGFMTPAGDSMVDDTLNGLGVVNLNNIKASEGDDIAVIGFQARDAAISGNNPVLLGARGSTATPTAVSTDGDVVDLWADLSGRLHTVVDTMSALVAGSALIGDVDLQLRATGGSTSFKLISAASTNATSVKASAGKVVGIQAFNLNAEERFLKFYNKASSPTVGTDTPIKVLAIPGATTGAGFVVSLPHGIGFSTGIALALTTGIADADTGAVAASEIVVNLDYA